MQTKRLQTSETVADDSNRLAHAHTLAATDDGGMGTVAFGLPTGPGGGAHAPAPLTATLPRTTVLPRVQTAGGGASLVYDNAPRYEAISALGEGGMGEVLKAKDNDIGRMVALKRLKPEALASAAPLARFVEEIRTVGQLEHPNIVPIHDVGIDENGQHYFVMKYVNGETLEEIIEKLAAGDPAYHRRFTFEHRVQIFMGILEAVAFAHDAGYLHRDIKPANVMVGRFGEVMLMDWGIAKRAKHDDAADAPADPLAKGPNGKGLETEVGTLVGTPAYMSPEQARGQQLDEQSDVYSLSVLFWELLTLRHPLASKRSIGEMLAAVKNEPVPIAYSVTHPHQTPVAADLSWYLAKGLEKDKAKRFESVQAMIDRLERRMEGDIPVQCRFTFMKRLSTRWLRLVDRHPVVAMSLMTTLAALTLILIPTLAFFALRR